MSAIMFDSHSIIKSLLSTGFTESQAEAIVRASQETVSQLATARDIQDVRKEIEVVRKETESLGRELRAEMKAMELRIVVKLGGMIVIATGVLSAVIRLLH